MKVITVFMTILFYFTSTLIAQDVKKSGSRSKDSAVKGKKILLFNLYLKEIKEKLPEIKRHKVIVRRARNSVESTKSIDDINLEANSSILRKTEYQINPSFQQDYTKGYAFSAGVGKKFSQTGTVFSTGVEYQKLNTKATLRSIERVDLTTGIPIYAEKPLDLVYHYPAVYIGIVQPLLFNSFGILDRFAKNDARMKLEIEKLKKVENDKSIMNYYKKIYFDWLLYGEVLKILERTIVNAVKLERQVKRKYRAGVADNDDIQKALSAVIKYREQRTQFKRIYNTLYDELKIFIDIDNFNPDINEFKSYFNKSSTFDYKSVNFSKTRASRILKLSIDNLDYVRSASKNSLHPKLNLFGNVKLKSQKEEFNNSISKMNDVDYQVGFAFSYPLGNHKSKSDVKRSELLINELKEEYNIAKNRFRKSMDSILKFIDENRMTLKLKYQNLRSLKSRFATERKKYSQARLNLAYLIVTENSIAAERINVILLKKIMLSLYFDYTDLTN